MSESVALFCQNSLNCIPEKKDTSLIKLKNNSKKSDYFKLQPKKLDNRSWIRLNICQKVPLFFRKVLLFQVIWHLSLHHKKVIVQLW